MSQLRFKRLARLLLTCALCLPAHAVQAAHSPAREATIRSVAQSSDSKSQGQLAALLESHLAGSIQSEKALDQGLDKLRARDARSQLEVLALGGVPAAWRAQVGPFLALPSSSLQRVEASLARLDFGDLRKLLEQIHGDEKRELIRLQAMQLLSKHGSSKDLRLLLGLATPLGSRNGAVPILNRRKLEAALIRMGEQDQRVPKVLGSIFRGLHEGLQPSIIRVLGQAGNRDALELLVGTLGVEQHLDAYVLNAISLCARRVAHPIDGKLLGPVRARLLASDPHVSMGAMVAAGALEDFEAIPDLIRALQQKDEQAKSQASHALSELTGLGYGRDPKRWGAWYQRESDWWNHDVEALRQDLVSGDQKAARAALERIASGTLNRHRLAETLLLGLRRHEAQLLVMTCAVLKRLASPVALSPLIGLLHHGDEVVVDAAHAALMGITQMKMPADPALWSRQINSP